MTADLASDLVHATAVAIGRSGVLMRGASGSGKSSLARGLLSQAGPSRFRALIADDQTKLTRAGSALIGSSPEAIAGRMEWRGLGILTVPALPRCRIDLVVDLVPAVSADRLPPEPDEEMLLGISLPRHTLPSIAETAVYLQRLFEDHGDE
ncbi:MAG: serine/threonine protein kinase [Pseudomonadota bacterium]